MVRLHRTGEDYRYRRRVDHFHCDGDDFFIELMVQLLQGGRLGISCGSENDINIGFRSELLDKTKSDTAIGTSDESSVFHLSRIEFVHKFDVKVLLESMIISIWNQVSTYLYKSISNPSPDRP